jgi:hypothetical protein
MRGREDRQFVPEMRGTQEEVMEGVILLEHVRTAPQSMLSGQLKSSAISTSSLAAGLLSKN